MGARSAVDDERETREVSVRDEELAQQERALAEEENLLTREMTTAQKDVEGLLQRLTALKTQLKRTGDDTLSWLQSKLALARVPQLDLDGHEDRRVAVRAEQIRARSWLIETMRGEIKTLYDRVSELQGIVDVGERALDLAKGTPENTGDDDAQSTNTHPGVKPLRSYKVRRDTDQYSTGGNATPKQLRVAVAINESSDANFYLNSSGDVSMGGVVFPVRDAPGGVIGTAVDLVITIAGKVSFSCLGMIEWERELNDEACYAVKFRGVPDAAAGAIAAFFDDREPWLFT